MGTSDLVPGVSGGTIALLLGIYDDFISSISGLFSRRFWPSLKFLLPILVGMLIAIGLLSQLFNYLLSQHHILLCYFYRFDSRYHPLFINHLKFQKISV